MADIGPPSFSLGLEFDLDSDVGEETSPLNQATQRAASASQRPCEDDDSDTPVIGCDRRDPNQPRELKRIRRGHFSEFKSVLSRKRDSVDHFCTFDDEIEDFSSQEDERRVAERHSSPQYHAVCSSSKISLHANGALITQSAKKKDSASSVSQFSNLETSSSKFIFRKLTTSPVRRFQLIDSDSDSDHPSISEGTSKNTTLESCLKKRQSNPLQLVSSNGGIGNPVQSGLHTKDLWEDFCPEKSFSIPTPALDEGCEEYFGSMKHKKQAKFGVEGCDQTNKASKKYEEQLNLSGPLLPAHRYFFHDDERIQELVQCRLPNFFPLGAINNRQSQHPSESTIDYM